MTLMYKTLSKIEHYNLQLYAVLLQFFDLGYNFLNLAASVIK